LRRGGNRNAALLILAEGQRHSGQEAVDRLIPELEKASGLEPGTGLLRVTPRGGASTNASNKP
jgi:hypothetical protein